MESYDDKTPSFNITRSFNISVTDENDPPFNVRLSSNTVKENAPQGMFIGQFSAEDEDRNPQQTLSFTLADDDDGRFAVSSNGTLTKKNDTDYETDKQHTVQVRVTDNGSPPTSVCINSYLHVLSENRSLVALNLTKQKCENTIVFFATELWSDCSVVEYST